MGFLDKLFGGSRAGGLTRTLATGDLHSVLDALTTLTNASVTSDELNAIDEAIRRRAGKKSCDFYQPGLSARDGQEVRRAPTEVLQLAAKGALLEDVCRGGELALLCNLGDLQAIVDRVREVGGDDQWIAFQLLFFRNRVFAQLQRQGEV